MKFLGPPQSGSQANTTSSHNTFGQYTRNRRKPVNPNTGKQSAVRSILSTLAKSWKALTDAQRAGWKALSDQLPRTDSLGQTVKLSGFQEYISLNSKRNNFGDATLSDAPASPAVVDSLSNVSLTHTGSNLNISFVASGTLAGQRLGVYVSPQLSSGVSFTNDLRLLEVTSTAPTSPIQIGSNYAARFGALVTGNRVIAMLQPYNAGFVGTGSIGTVVL